MMKIVDGDMKVVLVDAGHGWMLRLSGPTIGQQLAEDNPGLVRNYLWYGMTQWGWQGISSRPDEGEDDPDKEFEDEYQQLLANQRSMA